MRAVKPRPPDAYRDRTRPRLRFGKLRPEVIAQARERGLGSPTALARETITRPKRIGEDGV